MDLYNTNFGIIHNLLSKMLNRKLPPITGTTTLADIGLDSLDMMQLIILLESNFGITLPYEDSEEIATFGDLAKLLSELPLCI